MIPDESLPKAVSTLKAARFPSCSQGRQCCYAHDTVQWRGSPPPSEHFHISEHNAVMLFRKSETLWMVDTFQTSSKIILASNRSYLPDNNNPGLGEGAFPQSVPTVRVPSAGFLVEAYCTLLLRDWGQSRYGSFWMSMLAYVMQYVDAKGRLDLSKVADSRYRKFYCDVRAGKIGAKQAMKDFKKAMES